VLRDDRHVTGLRGDRISDIRRSLSRHRRTTRRGLGALVIYTAAKSASELIVSRLPKRGQATLLFDGVTVKLLRVFVGKQECYT
jgi:hypothetical protein